MRLDRLHRAYPSLHSFGVVHWVPVLSNIKTATGCESNRQLLLRTVYAGTVVNNYQFNSIQGWAGGAVSNKMPGCHLANACRSRSKHILQWRYRNEVSIQFNIGHLWFPHFLWRRTARQMATVELMPDHENKVFAFGILLVSGLQHDLHVLPVLAATILDFWLSFTAAEFWKQEWNWIFIYCCATSVLCVQSEFNMSLQTYPYLKQTKNTKTFSESDSNVIMSTFISQGRDMIFSP